jgi:serine/threonine protein kinase
MAGESPGQASWMVTGLAPGSVVGGYRIESQLGAGGMAVVFRARDEGLDRVVALKVLTPAMAGDAEFRERFIRESRAAARVDHPHIIPVHGAGESDGVLYLAMRFVSGGDLRSLIQREGPLTGERAAFLLSPVASALDAAHAAGLVHRDVKPANILIDTSPGRPDHPYLSDFGLAKGAASTTGLTGAGQFLGTPDFAAPEQISGKPTSAQADQYALACVAFTVLTGTLPFARDTSLAVLWAHMYDPPPVVHASRRDLPAAVDGVLARALAKNPGQRYRTCGEFTDALRGALGLPAYAGTRPSVTGGGSTAVNDARQETSAGPGSAPPTPTQTVAPHPSFPPAPNQGPPPRRLFSSRLAYVLAGAVILAGLAGGGWYLTSGRYAPVPLSQGPRMITVPPVPAGDHLAQATALLRKAGLTVAAKPQPVGVPSNPQLGTVAGTTPAAGTSWPENKPVVVNVVAGLALPNLVGQNIGTIQGWAGQNHINITPAQVNSSQPQGTIIAQSPAQNTPVQPGQTVSLQVSSGKVAIPDVQGRDCQQARQTLRQAGFNVTLQLGLFGDNVTRVSPTGQAPSGTTITLECGS